MWLPGASHGPELCLSVTNLMSGENQPDYVAGLRLNRAPFETDSDEAFFFADPSLTQRLKQLQHLTEGGGHILVVEGAAGSGKTTLLQQLVRRSAATWTLCRIQGSDIVEPTVALRQLAHQFGLDETAHPDELRRLIADFCQVTARTSQLPVLIIDDAERIPRTVLEQVLNLCGSPAETVRYLRVLLFGLPGLQNSLVKAGLGHDDPSLIHALLMPPLDEGQTDAYLRYRLSVAGYSGASPFSPVEVHSIHESAAGLRGRINQLAHQTLLEHLWAVPSHSRGGDEFAGSRPLRVRRPSRASRWMGAGVAAVVVAGIFWWTLLSPRSGDQSPTGIVTQELSLPLPDPASSREAAADSGRAPQLPPAAPVSDGAPLATVDDHHEAAGDPGERPLPLSLPAKRSVSTASLETAHVTPAESASPVAPLVVPDVGDDGGPEPTSAAAVAPMGGTHQEAGDREQRPADRPAPVADAQPTPRESGVYSEDWLRSQPPDAVTLQLVAVSREPSLHRFLNQHQLSGPTAYFHTLRNGKDWYVVVHGVYPDRTAAEAAIPALPEAIRQGGPWPRTFASIHSDIQAGAAP